MASIKYSAINEKLKTKLFFEKYLSIVDLIVSLNDTINRKELWIDHIKQLPKDSLKTFEIETTNFQKPLPQTEEIKNELESYKQKFEKELLTIPSDELIIVIITIFSNKSRDFLVDLFNSKITPPEKRKTALKKLLRSNYDTLIKIIDIEELEYLEISLRTFDRKFKKAIEKISKLDVEKTPRFLLEEKTFEREKILQ